MGRAAGIEPADHQLVKLGGRSVAIITRFDRYQDKRIPFLSGASLLGLKPTAARRIMTEVQAAVRKWRTIGKRAGIAAGTLAAYADAFDA